MRYVMNLRVRSVAEKIETVRAWKDAKGDAHSLKQVLGWLVVFDPGGMSILLEDRPPWEVGQSIKWTMEAK